MNDAAAADPADPQFLIAAVPSFLLMAAAIALPVSIWLLSLYRRAVLRATSLGAAIAPTPISVEPASGIPFPPPALRFAHFDHRSEPGLARDTAGAARDAWVRPWQTALVHAVAGSIFATVVTVAWLLAARDPAIPFTQVLLSFWIFFWPAALSVNLVAGATPSTRRGTVAAYFAVLAGIAAFGLARNPQLDWWKLSSAWLVLDAIPTALLFAFFTRPLRALGPIVLALAIVAIAGAHFMLGTGDTVSASRLAVVALATGALGWLLLRGIGSLYERKRISDEALLLAAIWLTFAVVYSIALSVDDARWLASGGLAFAGYVVAARIGEDFVCAARAGREPAHLLLLRDAATAARRERLFTALHKHWLHVGSVAVVAGGDVASAAARPHDVLLFLRRRIASRVVADERELAQRIASLDRRPDPDGRFRVDEFFCQERTWEPAMRALAAHSDAVLVDLRGFHPSNPRCVAALQQLVDATDLARVVFLVGADADCAPLEATLGWLWTQLAADSPNRRAGSHVARLVRDPEDSPAALRNLLGVLIGNGKSDTRAPLA